MNRFWKRIALALGFAMCAAVVSHGSTVSFHAGLHAAESLAHESSDTQAHVQMSPECDFCKASVQTRDLPELFDAAAFRPIAGREPAVALNDRFRSAETSTPSARGPPA